MSIQIPIVPNSHSLQSEWMLLDSQSNSALVKCLSGITETLIFVVFGDDFIAGMRADRQSWLLLPSSAVVTVQFTTMAASSLPPIRQTNQDARSYLQALGSLQLRIWVHGVAEPLPAGTASVQGRWLVLTMGAETPESMTSFDAVRLIEILDVDNSEQRIQESENLNWSTTARKI